MQYRGLYRAQDQLKIDCHLLGPRNEIMKNQPKIKFKYFHCYLQKNQQFNQQILSTHFKVMIFIHSTTSYDTNRCQGSNINIRVRKQEKINSTPILNAFLRQFTVEISTRLQYDLNPNLNLLLLELEAG